MFIHQFLHSFIHLLASTRTGNYSAQYLGPQAPNLGHGKRAFGPFAQTQAALSATLPPTEQSPKGFASQAALSATQSPGYPLGEQLHQQPTQAAELRPRGPKGHPSEVFEENRATSNPQGQSPSQHGITATRPEGPSPASNSLRATAHNSTHKQLHGQITNTRPFGPYGNDFAKQNPLLTQ